MTNNISIFVDRKGDVYHSQEVISSSLNDVIQTLLTTDAWSQSDDRHIWHTFHLHKLVFVDEQYWSIQIFHLPKHWQMDSCKQQLVDPIFEKKLIGHLLHFYKYVQSLTKEDKRSSIRTKRNNDLDGVLDIEVEISLLMRIYHHIIRRTYSRQEYICADEIIGRFDEELNKYHSQMNSRIQKIEVTEQRVFKIINTYIHLRYTKDFLHFLTEQSRLDLFPNYQKLLTILRRLKRYTKYHQLHFFHTKGSLKPERVYLEGIDSVLTKYLDRLLNFEIFTKRKSLVRHTVNMALAWERHLNIHKFGISERYSKPTRTFIRGKNENKTANPEYVDQDVVYDAKYKYISQLKLGSHTVEDSDLNKLMRDMLVFEKKQGELIYPKPEAISDLDLNTIGTETVVLPFESPLQDWSLRLSWFPFGYTD